MAWQLSAIFYSVLGPPQISEGRANFAIFSKFAVAQECGRGPSQAGQEGGNRAASDTS